MNKFKKCISLIVIGALISSNSCYAQKGMNCELPYKKVESWCIEGEYTIREHYEINIDEAIRSLHSRGYYFPGKKLEDLKILDISEANYKETINLENGITMKDYYFDISAYSKKDKQYVPTIIIPEELLTKYDIIKTEYFLLFNLEKFNDSNMYMFNFMPIKGTANSKGGLDSKVIQVGGGFMNHYEALEDGELKDNSTTIYKNKIMGYIPYFPEGGRVYKAYIELDTGVISCKDIKLMVNQEVYQDYIKNRKPKGLLAKGRIYEAWAKMQIGCSFSIKSKREI